jgi:hypothetical protein
MIEVAYRAERARLSHVATRWLDGKPSQPGTLT